MKTDTLPLEGDMLIPFKEGGAVARIFKNKRWFIGTIRHLTLEEEVLSMRYDTILECSSHIQLDPFNTTDNICGTLMGIQNSLAERSLPFKLKNPRYNRGRSESDRVLAVTFDGPGAEALVLSVRNEDMTRVSNLLTHHKSNHILRAA